MVLLAAAGAGGGLGCYHDSAGPTGFTSIAELQGSWTLTEWRAVSVKHPMQSLDLMAALAGIATLAVQPNGSATFTVSLYGQSPSVDHATLTLTGDTLRYDGISNDGTFILSGSGDEMTWKGVVPQYMDVNGDGLLDETLTRMLFRRTSPTPAPLIP